MTILFGSHLVHRAELWAASRGRWTLEIAYSDDVIPSGRVTVTWGSVTFVGTIDPAHVGYFNGEIVAKVVGGWGWSMALPAAWYQSDNPGLQGRFIATRAAEAVGETLYAATGTTAPATNLFRPLRVSYSRAKQTAGSVLEDVLAPSVAHWTDFDGSTRVGVRVAPLPAARVELLEYDAGSKWADIDADDPANLLGATIPADPIRGTPALVITELFAWAGDEGFRYRVAVATATSTESSRLAEVLRDLVRGFVPELPALELRRARVMAQASDGRVSLQQVNRAGEVADFGRDEANKGAVYLYPGIAGASVQYFNPASEAPTTKPEVVLAFSRADWSDPIAFLAAPKGQAGHVPHRVFFEAASLIQFVGNSDGTVRVGASPTSAVALAPDLVTYLNALEEWAAQTDIFLALVATAAMVPIPTPPAPYPDAIANRVTASGNISAIPATNLEAK
jgi:hypothetical protein